MAKLTPVKQCQNVFSEERSGLRANTGAYTNNLKMNGGTKTIWIKVMEPLGVDVNYFPVLRHNSFCLGRQGPLILTITAMLFSSFSECSVN